MKKAAILLLLMITIAAYCTSCNVGEGNTPDDLLPDGEASCTDTQEQLPEGALPVHFPSDKVSYILPGTYPESYAEDGEAFKWGYNVFVSKRNADDKLILSGNRNEGLKRTSKTDSGVYFQCGDCFGYEGGVFFGSEKILSEECVGMVNSWYGTALLIITNVGDTSYVYSAKLVDEAWVLNTEERLELGSQTKLIYYDWPLYPIMTYSPAETMYLVTDRGLVTLAVGEYLDNKDADFASVTQSFVEAPDYWHYLIPTSATELNGTLYIGDMFGVAAYDISTKTFTYYPADIRAFR